MENESWMPVLGFENIYKVSDLGRIKSVKTDKVLKDHLNGYGYRFVRLCKNGKYKSTVVHKVVINAFLGANDSKVIDHINGLKEDNKLSNLRYCSVRENTSFYFQTKNKSSRFIGVSFNKNTNKWEAKININGKGVYLGRYKTEQEASEIYQNKLKQILP